MNGKWLAGMVLVHTRPRLSSHRFGELQLLPPPSHVALKLHIMHRTRGFYMRVSLGGGPWRALGCLDACFLEITFATSVPRRTTMRPASDPAPSSEASVPLDGEIYEDDMIDPEFITYHGEESFDYGVNDGDMPDDAMYDEDEYDDEYEEELSSSPSIPDEDINFDLVYTLHTFIATVEGQATVQKGDHLVLLDDSNSYWWLVRVLVSQEVGYIPAENIETPYERLARLNKHRNVEIATARGQDNELPPNHVASGELIKSRTFGDINKHSGKVSALSRRGLRDTTVEQVDKAPAKKMGVLFGETEYLEHSDLDHFDEEYMGEGEDDYVYDDEPEPDEDKQVDNLEQELSEPRQQEHLQNTPELLSERHSTEEKTSPTSEESNTHGESRSKRPNSLLGFPGTEMAYNVTRVFAGENIESDCTFKTVLLNELTTSTELVHQALQRFQLQDNVQDYAIVLHHLDGEEQILPPYEHPLQMMQMLSNISSMEPLEVPSKHDSAGSLASLLDTSSSRCMYDYSDDRFGKLYLVRRIPLHKPVSALTMPSNTSSQDKQLRFTIQLVLYDTDLPDNMFFHPTTGNPTRGTKPLVQELPGEQRRFMRLAKNATVAEVIEAGIEAFQLPDAVVDGGDDIEDRTRFSRPRCKYVLHIQSASHNEQPLHPASKVLAAYDTLPLLQFVDTDVKRKSLDFAVAPGVMDDILSTDPLFVLRIAREKRKEEGVVPLGTPRGWQPSVLNRSPPSPSWSVSMSSSRERDNYEALPRHMTWSNRPMVQHSTRLANPLLSPAGSMREIQELPKPPPSSADDSWVQKDRDVSQDGGLYSSAPEPFAPLPSSSVQNEVDTMLSRLALDPALDPSKRALTSPIKMSPLNIPPPNSSLHRTSSIRSVSANDMTPEPRGMAHMPRRVGDRVLSDSTVATGTDRQGREKYNFHALYGIVDALVLEKTLATEAHTLEPDASSHNGLHRTSLIMAKLLEETPSEKIWTKWNGLFALPWPSLASAPSTSTEKVREHFMPLMKQISELENDLDDTLRSVLAYRDA